MSTALRVASFNIRNGRALDGLNSWPFRRSATAASVRALAADVVGLQEVFGFQFSWLQRELPWFDAYGLGRDNGRRGERCPVFAARGSARIVESTTRWYGPTPDRPGTRMPGARFPRLATIVRLQVGDEAAPLTVANTHLDEANSGNRGGSVDQLLGWLDLDAPLIVMGDLNTAPGADALNRLEAAGLRSALPPGAGGTTHNFTGRTDGRQIDHIFVSAHFEIAGSHIVTERVLGRLASDHWPIVADLALR